MRRWQESFFSCLAVLTTSTSLHQHCRVTANPRGPSIRCDRIAGCAARVWHRPTCCVHERNSNSSDAFGCDVSTSDQSPAPRSTPRALHPRATHQESAPPAPCVAEIQRRPTMKAISSMRGLPSPRPASSSQRSAGTVSGGVAEGAAEVVQALSPSAPSLKRQLSMVEGEADSQTSSQGFSKSQRSSLGAAPGRRAAAQRARALWTAGGGGDTNESGDEAADSGNSGLEFLLRACEMLEPLHHEEASLAGSHPASFARLTTTASLQGTPKITRQARHATAASADASPASISFLPAAGRRPVSRRLLARSGDGDDGSDYECGEEEDDDYLPAGGRPSRNTRAQRASARAASASAAPSGGNAGATAGSAEGAASASSGEQPQPAAAPVAAAPRGGRWSGEPKALITGPCMNPECEHPYDSPQWRKGPPQHPVLCNACGTRWLRNGTLKPLVPRRGLRYKNKPKVAKSRAAAAAAMMAAAAATAAAAAAAAVVPPALPPPMPARPVHHKKASAGGMAQPAHSSDASEGGRSDSEDPAALFSQQASQSQSLPLPAPLQACPLPFLSAASASFSQSMANLGPAALFGLDPVAAAAAAAEALKAAPALFATSSSAAAPAQAGPWGFFPSAQMPALFQSPTAAQLAAQADAAAARAERSRAAACEQEQQQEDMEEEAPAQLSQAVPTLYVSEAGPDA